MTTKLEKNQVWTIPDGHAEVRIRSVTDGIVSYEMFDAAEFEIPADQFRKVFPDLAMSATEFDKFYNDNVSADSDGSEGG